MTTAAPLDPLAAWSGVRRVTADGSVQRFDASTGCWVKDPAPATATAATPVRKPAPKPAAPLPTPAVRMDFSHLSRTATATPARTARTPATPAPARKPLSHLPPARGAFWRKVFATSGPA